jgi:hypothetical protein
MLKKLAITQARDIKNEKRRAARVRARLAAKEPSWETELREERGASNVHLRQLVIEQENQVKDLQAQNERLLRRVVTLQTEARKLEDEAAEADNPPAEPFQWMTKTGEKIAPCEMDDDHLRNTISFLARGLATDLSRAAWLNPLQYKLQALFEMLKEAEARDIEV